MSELTESAEFVPPYISFNTHENTAERMRLEGIPSRVDRSYLGSWSGSAQKQFMRGERMLGFLDEDNRPTPDYVRYIKNPEERPAIMRAILEAKYAGMLALGENATQQQLEEAFRAYPGISGATVAKAISFFLGAANYAGIKLSPHYNARRATGSTGTATRRKRTKPAANAQTERKPVPEGASIDTLKTRYVELLLDKLSNSTNGEFDKELADRIERLMGFGRGHEGGDA